MNQLPRPPQLWQPLLLGLPFASLTGFRAFSVFRQSHMKRRGSRKGGGRYSKIRRLNEEIRAAKGKPKRRRWRKKKYKYKKKKKMTALQMKNYLELKRPIRQSFFVKRWLKATIQITRGAGSDTTWREVGYGDAKGTGNNPFTNAINPVLSGGTVDDDVPYGFLDYKALYSQ